MKRAEKLLHTVQRSMQTVAYGNVIYRKMLAAGTAPDRLYFAPPDPWPGDSQAGLQLIGDQRSLFGDAALPRPGAALRNLRAVGSAAARQRALLLIEGWLDRHDQWHDVEWSPEKLGDRLAGWIGFYEFYAAEAAPEFIARLTSSLYRQWKHLTRAMTPSLNGLAGLRAIKGLIYGALNFDESDKTLAVALDLLKRQLAAEILPDGGHVTRNPSTQLHMLRHLIDLREVLKAASIEPPDNLRPAIRAMLSALKFFRHGDGALALFHGAAEESPLMIEAVFTLAESKSRNLRRLPNSGYESLTAGRSLLIADVAAPPPRGFDGRAHAGLGAFEFGQGRERLIVNCGAVDAAAPDWRKACAATAAHSTLAVEDRNACEVLDSGGLAGSVEVQAHRYEEDGHHCVEIKHDGYRAAYGISYRRLLRLSASGEELAGREELSGATGGAADRRFALRWHLHPGLQASLGHGGQTALLRSASGAGWRLRVEGADLALEPGIYCGSGTPRRSLQLKAGGVTRGAETVVLWSFAREKM